MTVDAQLLFLFTVNMSGDLQAHRCKGKAGDRLISDRGRQYRSTKCHEEGEGGGRELGTWEQ